jgi:hypothetical protein
MAYIEVEVGLEEFLDQELIDELEERGWYVSEDEPEEQLTREEKDVILDFVYRSKPGTIAYNIYEKLRKR